MRDVLIVSPRFPPTNAADMHRVRLSLPFYRACGWNPIVLTAEDETDGARDDTLSRSLPDDLEIIRVKIWRADLSRKLGFGQLDYRAFVPLLRAGAQVIRKRKIQLVFFSTTAFLTFALGPIWKKRFGCKLVYDYQDPWYQGPVLPYTRENAPGSWRKYRLTQAIARKLEPIVMRASDHIISVSDGYVRMLQARYAFLTADHFTVLPFPASRRDYDIVEKQKIGHSIFAPDGRLHWVYAGRAGPDMDMALSILFQALAMLKRQSPSLASKVRLHFVGTSYAPAGRSHKVVEPIAQSYGVADLVEEHSERIDYFQVLALYRDSDVVLVIGSESADYTASKFFNCLLSGRPLLVLFHRDSLVMRLAAGHVGVHIAAFGASQSAFEQDVEAGLRWALTAPTRGEVDADDESPWLADRATRVQCAIFDRLVAP